MQIQEALGEDRKHHGRECYHEAEVEENLGHDDCARGTGPALSVRDVVSENRFNHGRKQTRGYDRSFVRVKLKIDVDDEDCDQSGEDGSLYPG